GGISLLETPVDNDTPVRLIAEHVADAHGTPSGRAPRPRPWSRAMVSVQRLGETAEPLDGSVLEEDTANHRGFGFIGSTLHVICRANVIVPEEPTTGDVPGPGHAVERIGGPLAGLLPFHLGGEVLDLLDEFARGVEQIRLAVFQVVGNADPGVG